jgi:hypothetical protein
MRQDPIALFGEAEKGDYKTAYFCKNLNQLADYFGNPPTDSRGLHFAVQVLLFHHELIFFRVREEGFSLADYFYGFKLLEEQNKIERIAAICLPGVGDGHIIDAGSKVCNAYHSLIITSESDFYDYLTDQKKV